MLRNIAFILLIVFIFVIPTEKIILVPGLGSLARIVGIVTMFVWLLSVLFYGSIRPVRSFHICFLLFILWNGASLFWTVDGEATLERIVTWAQLGLLVVLIWDLLTTKALLRLGMQAYVAGTLVAAVGIIYNFTQSTEFVYGRYSAGGQHSVNIGLMIAIAIPIAWYLIVEKHDKTGGSKWIRILNILFLPVAGIGIALTGSRGAMIATFPAIIFMLTTMGRLPGWGRIALAICAFCGVYAALLIIPQSLFSRLGSAYSELKGGGSLTGRTQIWNDAISRFMENPMLGIGSNAFKSISEHGLVVHNSFLSVFVETGIPGGVLFLAIILLALVSTLSLPKLQARLWQFVLCSWFLGASALTFEHQKITWLVLAMTVAASVHASKESERL